MFFTNGSLYFPYYHIFIESKSYCLAIIHQNKFDVIICSETVNLQKRTIKIKRFMEDISYDIIILISLFIVSTLLLLGTFSVYSILPDLRNTHSIMLRRYSGLMIAKNILNITEELIEIRNMSFICVIIGIVYSNYITIKSMQHICLLVCTCAIIIF